MGHSLVVFISWFRRISSLLQYIVVMTVVNVVKLFLNKIHSIHFSSSIILYVHCIIYFVKTESVSDTESVIIAINYVEVCPKNPVRG